MDAPVGEVLNRIRGTWIDSLAASVCHSLGPRLWRTDMLAPWVSGDQLTLAAMLGRIATEDIRGSSPQVISQHFQSAGFVDSEAPPAAVAGDLVMPVLRAVRRDGAPWERWWDVRGLGELLVELWTGRRLLHQPPERVREELTTLWRVPRDFLDIMLKNSSDAYSCLPEDLLFGSATGTATKFMQYLVSKGKAKASLGDKFLEGHPGLVGRPDLAAVARRLRHRIDLERAVRRYVRNIPLEVEKEFSHDLNTWDARMEGAYERLTAHEQELIKIPAVDDLYGDQCLRQGRGIHDPRVMADGDLLWDSMPNAHGISVPEWIIEEIVTCGTRFFHKRVGPHPVWLATVESDAHFRAVKAFSHPGAEYGLGSEESAEGVRLWLHYPTPPGDPVPALRAPYTYSLSWVEHAWELLHLASVGYVRLVVVRLTGDGDLRSIGSIWLRLPEELCTELRAKGVEALRRLIGDEMSEIRQRIVFDGADQAAAIAFRSSENAKSEDLSNELALLPEVTEHLDFMRATRRLARARAKHSALLLDEKDVSEAETGVREAVEIRERALELLRATPNWQDSQAGSCHSPEDFRFDDGTIFVHLVNRFGRLQIAARWDRSDRTHFDLIRCDTTLLDPLGEAIGEWGHCSQDQQWVDFLKQLVGACTEMARAIAELAIRHGFNRLIISPTTQMELLPLHAAPLNRENAAALNDVFDRIEYAPTVRLVSALGRPRRRIAAADEVLVVAHSGACIPGVDPIDGPIFEADLVSSLHDSAEVLTEEESTPVHTLRAMSEARIIHVASHGLTHRDRWAAGLVLQGSSLGEATLTISKILSEGTFSNADLVILNACRTGVHENTARSVQTLRTLEAAFLARGARAVISTLWAITDLLAIVFSGVLHAFLGAGADPGSAFRDTICYLRRRAWRTPMGRGPVAYAESLIGNLHSGWRSDLDQQADENPFFWATFKITGSV